MCSRSASVTGTRRAYPSASMQVVDLSEIVPVPPVGRVFERPVQVGVADAAPGGRVRMDAIARWVQDLAYADVIDAQVADESLWVVRRMRIRAERFPRFG